MPNFTFWKEAGYFDKGAEAKPLLHLWSLGIEEQFYVVWPLTLYFVSRLRGSVTVVLFVATVASFIACVTMVQFDSSAAFYSPVTRAWELLLGAFLLASRLERIRTLENRSVLASTIGAALIAGSVLLLTKTSTFPGWWALMPTIGAALLIAAGPQAPINRVLSRRGFVAVGLISYPLYLWHWPLLSFAFIDAKGTPSGAIRFEILVASVVLAAVTYLFIERPFRRGPRAWWHVRALVAVMVFIGAVGLITYWQDGFKSRFPVTIQSVLNYASYEFATDARAKLCWLSDAQDFSGYAPECYVKPSTARDNEVLIWGDSHAARLYPGVRNAMGADANIGQFTRDSCPPILNYSYPKCRESNGRVLLEMKSAKPHTVVLFSVWSTDQDWAPGSQLALLMGRTLDELRSAGIVNIVLVGPAPKWKAELPTLLYEDWNQQSSPKSIPERMARGLDTEVYRVDAGQKAVAQTRQVRFVSLLDLLCNDKGCLTYPPDSPGKLFTWDYGHLTTEGATFVATQMINSSVIP